MRPTSFLITLDDAQGATLVEQIVSTLQRAIAAGRLAPGTVLPGSRTLADTLKVNRKTVITALQELEAEGWLVTEPNRGTFVAGELPSGARVPAGEGKAGPPQAGFDIPSLLQPVSTTGSGALLLADGAADSRLAPAEELAKGYQRALRRHGSNLLQDRDPMGTPFLREAVAGWIAERHGVAVDPARILITRGSRGALALLAATLFRPGDLAVVENPGNRGAWEVFTQVARLGLRPVAVDAEGLDVDALAGVLGHEKIRLLYLTPRRQFPTGCTLSHGRALELLALAAQHRLAILEDDYDGEFCYDGSRPQPLLALDRTGQVIHFGSMSRLLAPGLRLGYMVLPASLAPFMARARLNREEQGDPAFEWAVADLIRDGHLARHLRKVRRIYQTRRDFLVDLLGGRLGPQLELASPGGGMGLWLRAKDGIDAEGWVRAARSCGVVLNPPSQFYLEQPRQAFRMGFAQAEEAELREAVHRLEAGLKKAMAR